MAPLTPIQLSELLNQIISQNISISETNKKILLVYLKYYKDNFATVAVPEDNAIFAEWYQDMLMENKAQEEAFQIAFVADLAGTIADLCGGTSNVKVPYVLSLFGDIDILNGPGSYAKMLEVFGTDLIMKIGKLLDSEYRFTIENNTYITEINERFFSTSAEQEFDEDNPILNTKEKGDYEDYGYGDEDYTENYAWELASEFADEFGREDDFFGKHEHNYERLEWEIEGRVSENYNINKLDQWFLETGGFVTNVIEEALEVWKNRLQD